MFACGAPKYVIAAQLRLIHACLQMQQVVDSFGKKEDLLLSFHAGLASGVVVGGILGLARPKFDLWGGIHLLYLNSHVLDIPNTAARLAYSAKGDEILVTTGWHRFLNSVTLEKISKVNVNKSLNLKRKVSYLREKAIFRHGELYVPTKGK